MSYSRPVSNIELRLIHALRTRAFRKKKLISFPEVERVLSYWRFRKFQRDELLHSLEEAGQIRIISFQGIILEEGVLP